MKISIKRIEGNKNFEKALNKILITENNDIYLKSSEGQTMQEGNTELKYYYFDYVEGNKSKYKERSIITLQNNDIYYIFQVNKGISLKSILYQLQDQDILKDLLKIDKEYQQVNFINNIYNKYTLLIYDIHYYSNRYLFNDLYNKLEELQILKNEIIIKYNELYEKAI